MSLSSRLQKVLSPVLKDIKAYKVQPSTGMVKLDAMENPYTWPEEIHQQWLDVLKDVHVNRYPDADGTHVKAELKRVMGISDEYSVLLGNGSDELILLLMQGVLKPNATILAVEPSFVMYKHIAKTLHLNYHGVDLSADFDIDLDTTVSAIIKTQPAMIFLALPNNPTGNIFSDEKLKAIIEATSGLVVLDEAYTAFTEYDSQQWLAKYEHVIIMRTVSKIGLAGLRLGYLFAHHRIVNEIDKLRLPYNINTLTQATAQFILSHNDMLDQQTQALCAQRTLLMQQLGDFDVFECYPSEANFILVKVDEARSAIDIFEQLKQYNILIKCLDGGHPLLVNFLRFTVGKEEENQALIKALSDILH